MCQPFAFSFYLDLTGEREAESPVADLSSPALDSTVAGRLPQLDVFKTKLLGSMKARFTMAAFTRPPAGFR